MNNVKKSIGWADFSVNPIKGLCPVDCKDNQGKSYCYARRMYKRFKWNPEVRYILPGFMFEELRSIKKPSRIFWGSTFELFHDSIPDLWRKDIFAMVGQFPQHTHIFLTKQPQNLPDTFPSNCWVGVSVDGTDNAPLGRMLYTKFDRVKAGVKFISFEPLLADPKLDYRDLQWASISWVIVGQVTPGKLATMPKIEWVQEIVEACDKVKIPIFLKNNLMPLLTSCIDCGACAKQFKIENLLLNDDYKLRQEFPR